jgi:hypothetical protein
MTNRCVTALPAVFEYGLSTSAVETAVAEYVYGVL